MTDTIDIDERAHQLLASLRTGDWLDQQVFPALRWAVPGVIPEGFGLLVGPPKLGKSWLALGVGLSVAVGGKAFGHVDVGPARPVLYLALEDGDRRLQSRCRTLLAGEPIPANLTYATKCPTNDVVALIDAWLAQHGDQNPLVMLDTLGKVTPPALPGESAYARDYRVGGHLKNLTDRYPGTTLLVVHHTRKGAGDDWMDSTSGTQGLNGSADFTIALTRARNDEQAVLKVTGRDVRENEYAMTVTDGAWALVGRTLDEAADEARTMRTTVGVGDDMARVVELVNNSPNGVRAADVAHALDIDAGKARQYLHRAGDAGRIQKKDRGLYVSVTSVTLSRSDGPPLFERDTRDTCDTRGSAA